MKYLIDLHVHSNASDHAFSSLEELIRQAKEKKLLGFALTNHGPILPDSPKEWHFGNLKVIPDYVDGIRIYKGIEANIISIEGDTDLPMKYESMLDIVLAGFHSLTPYSEESTEEENTKTLENVIKRGEVDILAHLGNPKYPFDKEKIVKLAKDYNVAIEINNSSFEKSRKGSESHCLEILKLCAKYGTYISLGSDTHFSYNIGNFSKIENLVNSSGIRQEKVLNTNFEIIESFLKERRQNK